MNLPDLYHQTELQLPNDRVHDIEFVPVMDHCYAVSDSNAPTASKLAPYTFVFRYLQKQPNRAVNELYCMQLLYPVQQMSIGKGISFKLHYKNGKRSSFYSLTFLV